MTEEATLFFFLLGLYSCIIWEISRNPLHYSIYKMTLPALLLVPPRWGSLNTHSVFCWLQWILVTTSMAGIPKASSGEQPWFLRTLLPVTSCLNDEEIWLVLEIILYRAEWLIIQRVIDKSLACDDLWIPIKFSPRNTNIVILPNTGHGVCFPNTEWSFGKGTAIQGLPQGLLYQGQTHVTRFPQWDRNVSIIG